MPLPPELLCGWAGIPFAYMVLRPLRGAARAALASCALATGLQPLLSLGWVIAVRPASGYAMPSLHFGGFKGAGPHIHVMQATGILMMLLFLHLFFAPWRCRKPPGLHGPGKPAPRGKEEVQEQETLSGCRSPA